MAITRDKNAPKQGLLLACVAFALLFFGWLCTYMRSSHSFESKLNMERLVGYGRSEMDVARRNLSVSGSTKTTIYWPPMQHFDAKVDGDGAQYPPYRSLLDLVSEWNPDNPDPPAEFHERLQHFNYSDPVERAMAEKYRNAEVPFKLYDVPGFSAVSRLWSDEYLMENMDSDSPHVEESASNHFMYWNTQHQAEGYVPPTEIVDLSFKKWLSLAHRADEAKISSEAKHYYFMTGSPPRDRGGNFISRDLKLFSTKVAPPLSSLLYPASPPPPPSCSYHSQRLYSHLRHVNTLPHSTPSNPAPPCPAQTNNFFITDVKANKGIQCRFGMRGIIAEAHYDSGRNMIAMLKVRCTETRDSFQKQDSTNLIHTFIPINPAPPPPPPFRTFAGRKALHPEPAQGLQEARHHLRHAPPVLPPLHHRLVRPRAGQVPRLPGRRRHRHHRAHGRGAVRALVLVPLHRLAQDVHTVQQPQRVAARQAGRDRDQRVLWRQGEEEVPAQPAQVNGCMCVSMFFLLSLF